MMITCITCITCKLQAILFSLHDASHIGCNSYVHGSSVLTIHKLKLSLEFFQQQNTSTVLHGFIHSHITSSDLVDNNAVSFYSQLNGLLTTLGYGISITKQLTAFSSLGWYNTKWHNIGCKFRQKTKRLH